MIIMSSPSAGGGGLNFLPLLLLILLIALIVFVFRRIRDKKVILPSLSSSKLKVTVGVVLIILSVVAVTGRSTKLVRRPGLNQRNEVVKTVGFAVGAVGIVFLLAGLVGSNKDRTKTMANDKTEKHLVGNSEELICDKCGHSNPLKTKFCGNCGANIETFGTNTNS